METDLVRAVRALAAAGLEPRDPQDTGAFHGSGRGTYHVVETGGGRVYVSRLGPYFACLRDDARPVMQAAGFTSIDGALAETVLEPLRVHDLLFYWQDRSIPHASGGRG